MTDDNYPGKGDWWGDFLHYRKKALLAMQAEGRSTDEMVQTLNLKDASHAARILGSVAPADWFGTVPENFPMVPDILAGKLNTKETRLETSVAYTLSGVMANVLTGRVNDENFQQEAENAILFADQNMPLEVSVFFAKLVASLPIKWGSPRLAPIMQKWTTLLVPMP
jgi:hypothetical protein